jgi:ParB family chromosome partitioning protein
MQAIYIPIQSLHPFAGHPYKVQDNDEMNRLIESIQEQGVLTPLIIRPLEDTAAEYEVISGHRRLRAAQKAGLREVPAFIHAVNRDEAAIQLVDSNLHRENILPSEKAFAYKLKMEALDHRGRSCGQVGHKSRDSVSETESGRQVQRYIRLTHLLPGLLDLVDEGRIAFTVGVELSYLSNEEQRAVLEAIELYDCTPSYSQACRLHRDSEMMYAADTHERILSVMSEEKPNQREKVSFQYADLKKYFPSSYTPKQISDAILRLVEADYRRRRDRGAR